MHVLLGCWQPLLCVLSVLSPWSRGLCVEARSQTRRRRWPVRLRQKVRSVLAHFSGGARVRERARLGRHSHGGA